MNNTSFKAARAFHAAALRQQPFTNHLTHVIETFGKKTGQARENMSPRIRTPNALNKVRMKYAKASIRDPIMAFSPVLTWRMALWFY
jgi:hypothetical protein